MNIYDKAHPHNAVFVAQLQSVIEGKPRAVENRTSENDSWSAFDIGRHGLPNSEWLTHMQYRLAPRTVTRTITYPEPMRVAPEKGSMYWALDCTADPMHENLTWTGYEFDYRLLNRGFAFAIESDARAAAAAIFGGEA